MADISMCANKDCPSHEQCYRYMAKPNEYRQAYYDFQFTEDGECSYIIELARDEK